jgi:4-hydroxy-tetrahydrodipicolinate reductase
MAGIGIGVIGCGGRMGRMLVAEIAASQECTLSGGCARPGSATVGQDIGELAGVGRLGIAAGDSSEALFRVSAVAIDFTAPAATAAHAALAAELGKPIVIGTTGLSAEQGEAVRRAAERVPVVWAANTSLGINLLLGLVEQVARRLGPDWDIEIVEMHHRGKVDAPSGTALALEVIADRLGRSSDC